MESQALWRKGKNPLERVAPLASASFKNEDLLETSLEKDIYIHENDPVDNES